MNIWSVLNMTDSIITQTITPIQKHIIMCRFRETKPFDDIIIGCDVVIELEDIFSQEILVLYDDKELGEGLELFTYCLTLALEWKNQLNLVSELHGESLELIIRPREYYKKNILILK